MRLIHLANHHSTNIGNGALIWGTERVLKEDFPEQVVFIPEPWDEYVIENTFGPRKFDESFVEMVNQCSDGLIVGGAVALNGRSHLKNTGMRFDLPLNLWRKISKPLVFYGISYRVWPYQIYYNLEQLKKTMEYVLNESKIIFSVRNDGTKDWLESLLGYQSDRIASIPDPGLYVPYDDGAKIPQIAENRVNVILSLNNEDEIYRYGGKWRERLWKYSRHVLVEKQLTGLWNRAPGWKARKRRFLRHLMEAIERISKKFDVNIVLCPHSFDDYKIIGEFLSLCPVRIAHQGIVGSGVLKVPSTPYFYGLYAKADLAISMRVHSLSPAIALGTPVIALSSQTRITKFMQEAGLEDFVLDVFDPDLVSKLCQLMRYCIENRNDVKARLYSSVRKMREQTFAANKRIYSLFKSSL